MKKLHLFILSLFLLSSCTSNNHEEKSALASKKNQDNIQEASKPFTEGEIDVEITMPGNPLGEIFAQVDMGATNPMKQLENLAKKSSPEAQQKLKEFSNKNPMMVLNLLLLPWRSTIFLKGDLATAKFDAFNYHAENNVNTNLASGTMFMNAQVNKTRQITFHYKKDDLGKAGVQSLINSSNYVIKQTGTTENVAGFLCKKSIYTLKDNEPSNATKSTVNALKVAKVEVWSSDQLSASVNFLHPLYINEKGGIMKLKVFYTAEPDLPIVYFFKKVDARKVSASEMAIQQSAKIYDYSKDALQIGTQTMGILFGR